MNAGSFALALHTRSAKLLRCRRYRQAKPRMLLSRRRHLPFRRKAASRRARQICRQFARHRDTPAHGRCIGACRHDRPSACRCRRQYYELSSPAAARGRARPMPSNFSIARHDFFFFCVYADDRDYTSLASMFGIRHVRSSSMFNHICSMACSIDCESSINSARFHVPPSHLRLFLYARPPVHSFPSVHSSSPFILHPSIHSFIHSILRRCIDRTRHACFAMACRSHAIYTLNARAECIARRRRRHRYFTQA